MSGLDSPVKLIFGVIIMGTVTQVAECHGFGMCLVKIIYSYTDSA